MNKILHLFWGCSRPLSWLRLQTVLTFIKLNPDWVVKVWCREGEPHAPDWTTGEQPSPYNGKDYFGRLRTLSQVQVCKVPFDLNISDVHMSDYLRWYALGAEGGFWSDFDIVYIRPMSHLSLRKDVFLIKYDNVPVWPIGFMGALNATGMAFFEDLAKCAKEIIDNDGLTGYQTIGCILLEKRIKSMRTIVPQKMSVVYPDFILKRVKNHYFTPNFGWSPPPDCIGMHWYAGASFASEFEKTVMGSLSKGQNTTGIVRAIQGKLV